MADKKGSFNLWTKDYTPGYPVTRWVLLSGGLSQEEAQKQEMLGNELSKKHHTHLIYMALDRGEKPEMMNPAR